MRLTCPILQVMTDLEDKNEWKNCIDVTGVRLPTGYYFGASAGTGDLSGECVKGWLSAVNGLPSLQAFVLPSALTVGVQAQAVGWPLRSSCTFRPEETLGLGIVT